MYNNLKQRTISGEISIDNVKTCNIPMTPQRSRSGYLSHRYHHSDQDYDKREKITINVSGERYQTYVDTLELFPHTLLGNSSKREQFYDDVEDEYFFDRDRNAFNAILYYYQSYGQLHCPLTVPMTILVSEAKFFDLGNDALKQVLDLQSEDKKLVMPTNKWQKKIWCLFDHPETSRAAHYLTLFSVLMIIFSVTILCIETLPELKENEKQHQSIAVNTTSNTIYLKVNQSTFDDYRTRCVCACTPNQEMENISKISTSYNNSQTIFWRKLFETSEYVFVAWFTLEYTVRFASSPIKIQFMKGFLNIIDLFSILPFYITIILNKQGVFGLDNLRIFRLVRVFRVFKLSRHSKGLQILGETFNASKKELVLLIIVIGIGVILFSSVVYYLEPNNFRSIPEAFWWAIITMCTVGYGDKVPATAWGKLVGSVCAICGVLSIALPVPVIVSNFDYFYNRERTQKMHQNVFETTEPPTWSNPTNHNNEENSKETPLLQRQRFPRSPMEQRTEEIQRVAARKDLTKLSRRVSKKLSEASLYPSHRPYGSVHARIST